MHGVHIWLPLPAALILFPLAGVPFKSCRDASVLVQAALPREDAWQIPGKHFLEVFGVSSGLGVVLSLISVLVCPHTAESRVRSMEALHNSLLLLQMKVDSLESGWTLRGGQEKEVIQFTKWKFFLFYLTSGFNSLFSFIWKSYQKAKVSVISWTVLLHNSAITLSRKPFQTFSSVHQIIKYILSTKNTVISCFHPS